MGKTSVVLAEQEDAWLIAHEALSRLARQRAAADVEEGRWLLAALRAAAHVHLGFGSFAEYIERSFGYKPRSTQEKLRVAEALEELPLLSQALSEGTLHWSSVRELTRVAVAETEREWLELARGKTLRQLEELVAGRRLGDEPSAPPDPSAQRHVVRFEILAETLATLREARSELRRRSGAPLDDDALLLELSRALLAGPRDEGKSSYQISLRVCPECGSGKQAANGDLVSVDRDIVAMARCDAQQLGHVDGPVASPFAGHSAPAKEASVAKEATAPANGVTAPSESAPVGAKNRADRCDGAVPVGARIPARSGNARVGAQHPTARPEGAFPTTRATQSIPPALRRRVLIRDQRRCRVPGCRNATFLDLHHIELREEGGRNTADNLLTLCGVHHRAAHRGELAIEGSSAAAVFRHADGSDYGQPLRPRALDVAAKVFAALRHLGFREGEVRRVLGELREQQELREASAERLLREALLRLHPSRAPFR